MKSTNIKIVTREEIKERGYMDLEKSFMICPALIYQGLAGVPTLACIWEATEHSIKR